MTSYRAPLADIDFTLNHVVDLAAIAKLNGFQHADPADGARPPGRGGPIFRRSDRPPQCDR